MKYLHQQDEVGNQNVINGRQVKKDLAKQSASELVATETKWFLSIL